MIIVHPSRVVALNWQLLINELRLLGHEVTCTDEQYSADSSTGIPVLLVSDDSSVLASSSLPTYLIEERYIDSMTPEIDEIARTKTYTKLDYDINAAIQLYRDKHVALVREILSTDARIIVLKGIDSVLILRESGNEYTQKPSAMQRLANLGVASKAILRTGFSSVTETIASVRLKTCLSCPYLAVDTCLCCGCHVPAKVYYSSQSCPKGKWHATDT